MMFVPRLTHFQACLGLQTAVFVYNNYNNNHTNYNRALADFVGALALMIMGAVGKLYARTHR